MSSSTSNETHAPQEETFPTGLRMSPQTALRWLAAERYAAAMEKLAGADPELLARANAEAAMQEYEPYPRDQAPDWLRENQPRTHEPWTALEDEHLQMLLVAKMDIESIAVLLKRMSPAIASRLRELGYIEN